MGHAGIFLIFSEATSLKPSRNVRKQIQNIWKVKGCLQKHVLVGFLFRSSILQRKCWTWSERWKYLQINIEENIVQQPLNAGNTNRNNQNKIDKEKYKHLWTVKYLVNIYHNFPRYFYIKFIFYRTLFIFWHSEPVLLRRLMIMSCLAFSHCFTMKLRRGGCHFEMKELLF